MSTSNAGDSQSDRVTNLELLFTHLERQLAELSSVVLEQGQKIERLERELRRQREARETNAESADEEGDEWPSEE
jgi:uncharacterized coiled-coil protein SlyX